VRRSGRQSGSFRKLLSAETLVNRFSRRNGFQAVHIAVGRKVVNVAVSGNVSSRRTMKQIFSSPDSAQMGLVRSVLEAAEIPSEVRNESVSQAIPSAPFASELWVHDEDFEEATRLLASDQSKP
jgi:hypothetical protein